MVSDRSRTDRPITEYGSSLEEPYAFSKRIAEGTALFSLFQLYLHLQLFPISKNF